MSGINMLKADFIFLHGFLGVPSDWEDVIENIKVDLEEAGLSGEFHVPDYFNNPYLSPKNSLEKVAAEFINWMALHTKNKKKILIGYSLGGRLALHVFEKNPDYFEKLVCVSTHPGLKSTQQEESKERDSRDHLWAELFMNQNWSDVVQKWNEQTVFEGSEFEPERDGSAYRRDMLAKALVNWSLAKQVDKRPLLQKYQDKILWVVGEKDKKFVELAGSLKKEIPLLKSEIVPMAGHRVLFDNAFDLARCISSQC